MNVLLPLVQLGLILLLTTVCGLLAQRLRQPRVVGEITGGLLLGPVALGHLFPKAYALVFPPTHMQAMEVLSYVGLVLFLFLTGTEVDIASLRQNRGATLAITLGNIGLPFALGAMAATTLRAHFGLTHVSLLSFVMFSGIAMSITALPVLARILEDRRGTANPIALLIATTSLLCAAANDLVAWSLLAITLATAHFRNTYVSPRETVVRLGILLVFVALMLQVVRPAAKRLLRAAGPRPWVYLPPAIAVALLSAHVTDVLGIHAFFGAFLAGVCLPFPSTNPALDRSLHRTLRPIVRVTLPVFFALTGLRMQPGVLSRGSLPWFGLILALAVFGKIGGALFAARGAGMTWAEATQIGILSNTRGLVELIVLNVGLKTGMLNAPLFTLFVLMALVTTAMTVPLLDMARRYAFAGEPAAGPALPSSLS